VTRFANAMFATALAMLPMCVLAQAVPPSVSGTRARDPRITLLVGEGRLIRLPGHADSVAVSRPEVADVQMLSPTQMFVFGKANGLSAVTAVGSDGHPLVTFAVEVTPDLAQLRSYLAELGGHANASTADGAIQLQGEVATPAQAQAAEAIARQVMGGKSELVRNLLGVASSSQVNLRVRIAEVSRSLVRELGFNFDVLGQIGGIALGIGTGRQIVDRAANMLIRSPTGADNYSIQRHSGNLDLNGVIDALEGDGLVTVLAEPNLTARSGETASFLSGGEFPIPISNFNNSITVEFKKFGVALDFTPTVMQGGRISLHVRPEVSQLDQNAGIAIGGIRIPGLRVRRADTTVELASGQSFAIAGLLQANSDNNIRATPGLGEIPILGALFRSTRFQRNETELVIMVTPYLVEPASSPRAITTPIDAVHPAVDFESLFLGRIAAPERLPKGGDTGFIVE